MKIYIPHATSFDYMNELYVHVRSSAANIQHDIILPHEGNATPGDTRDFISGCDLVIAETSYASTGMGIELGWAHSNNKPIVAIHRKNHTPSASISMITDQVYEYEPENLGVLLARVIAAA